MKIGVFDSGKGGTTVLSAIKSRLKDAEYFYIADSKNCPYGEKTDQELYKIVKNNVETLIDWGAELIVIACNTATTKCIKKLRQDYPDLAFVGTEPAIKLAIDSGAKNILVLATPGTIKSERTKALTKGATDSITLLSCPGLADTIEENFDKNDFKIDQKLSELFANLPNRQFFDAVVLGCTHYPLIKPKLQKIFPTAKLVDGGDGVARQVERLVTPSSSQNF